LQSQVAFVRGKYADSFKLLWDAGTLYDECGSSRSRQLHLQLRLISTVLPIVGECVPRLENTVSPANAAWTEQRALVENIVQCFQKDDVVCLRSQLAEAEAKLGRFAAVEIGGALLRNRISRRMAAENWLDSAACLSRWNVDVLKLVGRSMSYLIDNHTHTLPLKNITSVRVESAHADQTVRKRPFRPVANASAEAMFAFSEVYREYEYELKTSAHDGALTIQTLCEGVHSQWKPFATVATPERFHDYSSGSVRTRNVTPIAM
ncbi:hypothetical protein AAVH_39574, partial [Aphelenchoides avenae]